MRHLARITGLTLLIMVMGATSAYADVIVSWDWNYGCNPRYPGHTRRNIVKSICDHVEAHQPIGHLLSEGNYQRPGLLQGQPSRNRSSTNSN